MEAFDFILIQEKIMSTEWKLERWEFWYKVYNLYKRNLACVYSRNSYEVFGSS